MCEMLGSSEYCKCFQKRKSRTKVESTAVAPTPTNSAIAAAKAPRRSSVAGARYSLECTAEFVLRSGIAKRPSR
jgi:hypothetical protein